MKTKKLISILIITLLVALVVGGIFYFGKSRKPIVYENYDINNNDGMEEESVDDKNKEIVEPDKSAEVSPKVDKDTGALPEKNNTENSKETEIEAETEKEKDSGIKIKEDLVSWGFSSAQNRKIDTIILHSSYNILGGDEYDFDKIILEYKQYGVAPHYIIDRKGDITRLVKDSNIAYHAGESQVPDGRTGVNNFSIGIELINNQEDKFTKEQYGAVNELIVFLKEKYNIKYILGHSDIAPGRKTDPWNIDWQKVNK